MNAVEVARKQMRHIRKRTKQLLEPIDAELWYEIPEGIDCSIAWQAGHLALSHYFNGIVCTAGPTKEIRESFPIKAYAEMYGIGSDPKAEHELRPTKEEFMAALDGTMELFERTLDALDESSLDEDSVLKHPVYKTKGECLDWTFLHETWHLGQIAMIRRGLGVPMIINPNP